MTFIISLAVSVVFGAGAFLILQRNLVRVVIGIVLISNAANLFIVAAGITRGRSPIYPLPDGGGDQRPARTGDGLDRHRDRLQHRGLAPGP